jgi:pSer/pThr/pTyr-binding forkhead associated (FHA) protein
MKLSLVVVTSGKGEGTVIPIQVFPFVIGRDAQCHLRPASPLISKRHCALTVKGGGAFVTDLNSTNGTFVNGGQITGEVQLHDSDQLKLGPLVFKVVVEMPVPANQQTPPPPPRPGERSEDDMVGALLLGLRDEGGSPSPGREVDCEGVPTGNTVMAMPPPAVTEEAAAKGDVKKEKTGPYRPQAAAQPMGDTTEAAKQILDKYLRRTRS